MKSNDRFNEVSLKCRRFFTMVAFYKLLGVAITALLFLSATYSAVMDLDLVDEVFNLGSWSPIFSKEYFKDLFFSPLWLLAAFFFSKANSHDYMNWKKQKNGIEGHLMGKEQVFVKDILKFLVDEYSIEGEYAAAEEDRQNLKTDSESLNNEDLRVD